MMNYKWSLFLFVILTFSCTNHGNKVLPDKYKIKEITNFSVFPVHVVVYKILTAEINLEEIQNYQINCNESFSCQSWITFSEINEKDKSYVLSSLDEMNKNQPNENLIKLNELLNSKNVIYFSGCFTEMQGVSNKKYNFYSLMSFLDPTEKKLYKVEEIN